MTYVPPSFWGRADTRHREQPRCFSLCFKHHRLKPSQTSPKTEELKQQKEGILLLSLTLFYTKTHFVLQRLLLPAYINSEQGHVLDIAALQSYLTIAVKTRKIRIFMSVVHASPSASKGQSANKLD